MVVVLTIIRKGFIIVFFFIILSSAPAERSQLVIQKIGNNAFLFLDDIVNSFDLESSFDIITQKGKLYHKSHFAVFTVLYDLMVIDGRLFRSVSPVIRSSGAVMIPRDAALALLDSFFQEYEFIDDGKRISCIKKDKPDEAGVGAVEPVKKGPKDKIRFIVIDPGHGGKDPGAVGKGGLLEKNITLKVAKYLETELKRRFPDIKIMMTRRKDTFIELSKRTDYANRLLLNKSNGLFLSIHVNATLSPVISGFETYYLSQNPSNDEARNTAALENNVIVLEEGSKGSKLYNDIDYIEAMMLTTQIQKESMSLAECVQKGLAQKTRGYKSRGTKSADFFVLRGALMPAVLVEIGFITNKKEAKDLNVASHQKNIASGISAGIADFLKKYNAMLQ